MTNDDLNQIRGVVKEEIDTSLKQIKETLDSHTKTLDSHTKTLEKQAGKLNALWEQTEKLTVDMGEVKEILNSHTKSLNQLVANNEQDKDNVRKLDKRIGATEDHLGIVPPPELTLI